MVILHLCLHIAHQTDVPAGWGHIKKQLNSEWVGGGVGGRGCEIIKIHKQSVYIPTTDITIIIIISHKYKAMLATSVYRSTKMLVFL